MIAVFSEDCAELNALAHKLKIVSRQTIGAATFFTAVLNDTKILLVDTGYAKVNCGAALALAGYLYQVDTVIALGDCGCLQKRGAKPGHVAVSQSARQYDVDYSAIGYTPSLIIGLEQPQYPADEALVALAQRSARALGIPCFAANFGSADRFLANGDTFYRLSQKFGFDAVDDNTGSVGEYATMHGVPYVSVKGVSHYGDEKAPMMYEHYRTAAWELACRVVYRMLDALTGGEACECEGCDNMSIDIDLSSAQELTRADCLSLLSRFSVAHVCTVLDGHPYTIPMAFCAKVRGDHLTFCLYSTPDSEKIKAIEQSGAVCLSFERITPESAVSVIVTGTATVGSSNLSASCNEGLTAIRVVAQTVSGRRYARCAPCSAEHTAP